MSTANFKSFLVVGMKRLGDSGIVLNWVSVLGFRVVLVVPDS